MRRILFPVVILGLIASAVLLVFDWNQGTAHYSNMLTFDNYAVAFSITLSLVAAPSIGAAQEAQQAGTAKSATSVRAVVGLVTTTRVARASATVSSTRSACRVSATTTPLITMPLADVPLTEVPVVAPGADPPPPPRGVVCCLRGEGVLLT